MFKAAGEALVFLVIGLIVSPAVISCGVSEDNQKHNSNIASDDDETDNHDSDNNDDDTNDNLNDDVDDDTYDYIDDDVNADDDINVEEWQDPNADWDCDSHCECVADYLRFIELADRYSNPISEEELARQLDEIGNGNVRLVEGPLTEDELREALISRMNIGFLRENIDGRLLQVITTETIEFPEYREKHLLFTDPYVGSFKGILLIPKSAGPHPGIVAIHGHWDSAEVFRDEFGNKCPSKGYAILMLTMRNMCVDYYENLFTRSLLLSGFTAMGIRSYETLLGLKYLRFLPEVDGARIGLIGHSGGSVANNLTIRTEKIFKAMVTDCFRHYIGFNMDGEGYLADESAPNIWPYHELINEISTSSIPIMAVPYGYEDKEEEIFQFFNSNL